MGINPGFEMMDDRPKNSRTARAGGAPLIVAILIAILGVLGMLIIDHGPWNKPHVKTAVVANSTTTGVAAREAGAMVIPTEPKGQLEPETPGPKPVHPANPALPHRDF
jgi:hypothetical protein